MTESRPAIYTAEAHVTGGRAEGHGRTSDGALEVDLRTPGRWEGAVATNPEQLFAVGYAACFESALGVVARRRRQEAGDVAIDSRVMLLSTADRDFKLAVALAVTLPSVDDSGEAVELVKRRTRCARTRTPRAATSRSRSPRTGATSKRPRNRWLPEPAHYSRGMTQRVARGPMTEGSSAHDP